MKHSILHTLFCIVSTSLIATAKPNILFILVDDLGYGDVGFNGSKYYETPHIDALARQSLILDSSYMYPSCSPSRTAYFTGKQSFRTGVYTVPVLETGDAKENIFSRWTVEQKHRFFSQELEDVGYQGIHLGKWHVVGPYPNEELSSSFPLQEKLSQPSPGDFSWVETHRKPNILAYYPEGRGFKKNVGGTYRGDPALQKDGYKSDPPIGGYFAPFVNPFIEQKSDDHWLTDRLTDEAIQFIDENKHKPFFVNLNYYTVHRPTRKRSEESYQKYLSKQGDEETGQGTGKRREEHAAFATMIESLDDNIGKIIAYLRDNGLEENTLIVFTSDNGQNKSQSINHRLRGAKGEIYEGGVKVPTFIHWKGTIHSRRSSLPTSVLDYYPTFLELAETTTTGIMDGQSLTPLFQTDHPTFENRPVFWHIASRWKHGTCSAMRKQNYKLIQFLKDGKVELYNLETDPLEKHNLAKQEPELTQSLLSELVQWRKTNKAPLPENSSLQH